MNLNNQFDKLLDLIDDYMFFIIAFVVGFCVMHICCRAEGQEVSTNFQIVEFQDDAFAELSFSGNKPISWRMAIEYAKKKYKPIVVLLSSDT